MKRHIVIATVAALALGALGGAQIASTAGGRQPASVFTPIVPCRLLDTRPTDRVNEFATLGPGQVHVVEVWGEHGDCDLPTGTTAIALNVTSVGGTAPSFLTLWPSDAAGRPNTSNLNWLPGQAPTPNKVDVALSSNGKVRIFNANGSVDVIADVLGYYTAAPTPPVPPAPIDPIGDITVVTAAIDVEPTSTPGDTGSNGQATVKCPKGQVAISGGVSGPLSVALNVRSSRPSPVGDNPTGWYGDVRSADEEAISVDATVYAMCVTP